jgi:hypothetical protein
MLLLDEGVVLAVVVMCCEGWPVRLSRVGVAEFSKVEWMAWVAVVAMPPSHSSFCPSSLGATCVM